MNTKAPTENRIKLPPLSGPPLDAIAQSVISAQQDVLTEQTASGTKAPSPSPKQNAQAGQATAQATATTRQPQPLEKQEITQAAVERTLRLDGKELQKEHRRMRRQEESATDNSTGKRSMGKWMAGGAMILLVLLLAVWKAQEIHRQTENIPPSGSPAPSGRPITSAGLSARGQSLIPAPAVSQTALSGAAAGPSTLAGMASVNASHASHVSHLSAINSAKPAIKPALERATASKNAPSPAPHGNRAHRQRTDTSAENRSERAPETRHKPQATQAAHPNPAAATRHTAFHDEDTFPSHSHSGHTDNSDEWTDKIP